MNILARIKKWAENQSTDTTVSKLIAADDAKRILDIVIMHSDEIDAFSMIICHEGKVETYISGMTELQAIGVLDIGKDQLKLVLTRSKG